jgi:hypothetical protein
LEDLEADEDSDADIDREFDDKTESLMTIPSQKRRRRRTQKQIKRQVVMDLTFVSRPAIGCDYPRPYFNFQ